MKSTDAAEWMAKGWRIQAQCVTRRSAEAIAIMNAIPEGIPHRIEKSGRWWNLWILPDPGQGRETTIMNEKHNRGVATLERALGKKGAYIFPTQGIAEDYLRALPEPYVGRAFPSEGGKWMVSYHRKRFKAYRQLRSYGRAFVFHCFEEVCP